MAREGTALHRSLPFPLSSSAKGLIVRDRHDKRLRFSVLTCDFFSTIFAVVLIFSVKMAVFVFLKNIHLTIEILKIEISRIILPSFEALFLSLGLFSLMLVSPEGCAVPIWQNGTYSPDSPHQCP